MTKKKPYEIISAEDVIRRVTSWTVDIILVLTLAFFLTWAFGTRVTMEGNSMAPLISGGDKLLINRTKGKLIALNRFDVAAYTLSDDNSVYLKLILGLPGETVQIRDGKVYIDGRLLEDDRMVFMVPNAGIAEEPVLLGEDEYFVIGRSPDASRDSRFADVGNIRASRILGTVWLRYSPFTAFGAVRETAEKETS